VNGVNGADTVQRVSVCLDKTRYKFFQKGKQPVSCDPINFWALNANSSKTVKTTDFKFDVHSSRNSLDINA